MTPLYEITFVGSPLSHYRTPSSYLLNSFPSCLLSSLLRICFCFQNVFILRLLLSRSYSISIIFAEGDTAFSINKLILRTNKTKQNETEKETKSQSQLFVVLPFLLNVVFLFILLFSRLPIELSICKHVQKCIVHTRMHELLNIRDVLRQFNLELL